MGSGVDGDVFNMKGDGHRAIQHARYAIGLVKGGASRRTEEG